MTPPSSGRQPTGYEHRVLWAEMTLLSRPEADGPDRQVSRFAH